MAMTDLERGALVHHATLGLGKVVAVEADAVHVFFPGRGERFAAKLRLPGARAFLRTGVEDRNAWLEGLSSFTLDPGSGRWALPARWLTLDQAIAHFQAAHPRGFSADAPGRGASWRAAHRVFGELLGAGQAERLLEAGNVREVVRRLVKIGKGVSALHGEEEREAVEDALGDDDATRRFLRALFALIEVPSPMRARFDALHAAAAGLPVSPAARWLLVTLFPYLARPDRHPLFRPGSTREAAERLGFDLRYDESPNWTTLAALRAHSARLLEALAPSGAKDFIDVEVFAHAASTMRAGGARRATKRAEPAARPAPVAKPAPAKPAPAKPAARAAPRPSAPKPSAKRPKAVRAAPKRKVAAKKPSPKRKSPAKR
jgi:hypothetical protein